MKVQLQVRINGPERSARMILRVTFGAIPQKGQMMVQAAFARKPITAVDAVIGEDNVVSLEADLESEETHSQAEFDERVSHYIAAGWHEEKK